MRHIRRGTGKPVLLIHGQGGHWQSWNPILADLVATREVIAVDLPGFGRPPKLAGETSIRSLADETAALIHANGLSGVDVVGSSMGARLVLELARRRGRVGGVVALNPGGFWQTRPQRCLRSFGGRKFLCQVKSQRYWMAHAAAVSARITAAP